MKLPLVLTFIRNLLQFGGGYLVSKGLIDEAGSDQLIGAVMTTIGLGWSVVNAFNKGPTPPTGAVPVVLLISSVLCLSGCGTTNPRAVAYTTLKDVMIVVDKAESFYGDQCYAGKVSLEQQSKIDAKIIQFHAVFGAAVQAARSDYTSASSPDLDALAQSLITLIYSFATEPAP